MPTRADLKTMQSWSLIHKTRVTQTRIIEWYERHNGQVYVSFSGGKDSTILLDLARRLYPDIPAVFCDTGLEYPEIRDFVKTKKNVETLRPLKYVRSKRKYIQTNFHEVIETCGYPVISKEISQRVSSARNNPECKRAQILKGTYLYNGKPSRYTSDGKWWYLVESDFPISAHCCDIMKKTPFKQYEKQTGRKPIVATMACESDLRRSQWLKSGCNSFDGRPMSRPMSFWTEQDIKDYLVLTKIPYCKIYGDIYNNEFTGVTRTGCMFCMFGVHLEKGINRFQRMARTHPKQYDYCINTLGCGKVLDFIGVDYKPK